MSVKPNFHAKHNPWYRKTRGIVIIFLVIIGVLLTTVFLIQVYSISQEINLADIKTAGLTVSDSLPAVSGSTINRKKLETLTDPHIGNPAAELVIVEFGDFECPFCALAFPIIRGLQSEFQDQVLFIWRDLPLRDIHPNAQKAAEAGECAHEQGKFWPYHDRLFINQARLTSSDLKNYARQIGLAGQRFDECLDSGKYFSEVSADLQTALDSGAAGTPTFFINGQLVSGVIPRDVFRQIIQQYLADE